MKSIIFIIFCFFSCFSFSQDITLTFKNNIASEIAKGQYGDRFLLKKGVYLINTTIFVPSGVTIYGEFGVNISTFSYNEFPVFDITGSENVEISNLNIELNASDSGIIANPNAITQNIKINKLRFSGNTISIYDEKNRSAGVAISLMNARNIDVSDNTIQNSVGGIYVYGENIHIAKNQLKNVNWGNIVVNGSHIDIVDNLVLASGIGTFSRRSEGDAITVLDNSSNVKVLSNTLDTGYCYLIWVHPHCRNVDIKHNYLKGSITTGVYIDSDVEDLVISHNEFIGNIGFGLSVLPVFGNVAIEDNRFVANSLYVDPRNPFLNINNNIFSDILIGQPVINEDYSFFNFDTNYTLYSSSADYDPPDLLVIDESGHIISNHDILYFDRETFNAKTFLLINQGQIPLKFIGLPFIQLSSEILREEDYRSNQFSFSHINDLYINPLNQPKTSLLSQEMTMFKLEIVKKLKFSNEPVEFIVNIPTDYYLYNPYWFKMVLR